MFVYVDRAIYVVLTRMVDHEKGSQENVWNRSNDAELLTPSELRLGTGHS